MPCAQRDTQGDIRTHEPHRVIYAQRNTRGDMITRRTGSHTHRGTHKVTYAQRDTQGDRRTEGHTG